MTFRDPGPPSYEHEHLDQVPLFVPAGEGVGSSGVEFVPVGTKVRVVDDPEGAEHPDHGGRNIHVRVLEGRHADRVGRIDRKNLRPAPK